MKLAGLLLNDRMPEHPIAHLAERTVYRAEFSRRVSGLSHALMARQEKSWLLVCPEPLDFVIALFAVWHAGRRALLPPSMQTGAIAEIRNEADGLLATPDSWPTSISDSTLLQALDPEKTRLDLYTSGSSGQPKRIEKKLTQLENEIACLERQWGGDDHPVLATVPHHHIYGLLFRLLWPLAAGRPFDNQTCSAPEFLLARLERLGPARVVSSPSQLTRMPDLIPLASLAGHVSSLFSSGGPLPAGIARQFREALNQTPQEILGSTETGGIAWRTQTEDDAWTPFPEVTVSTNEDNALTLISPFLPDLSPLVTDDAAKLLDDGRFRLLGRRDRIVKIEEKRLSLSDMETRLATHPWVREAALAVLAGRRHTLGAALTLTNTGQEVLRSEGRAALARHLRQHLAHWFDAILLPRRWRYPENLPYNERGKLRAADLSRLFEEDAPHER